MAAKKRVDPIKQREKRAKIAAGVGVVLLIAVGAYEIPSMLAVMNKKPPAGAQASDAGNRNPDGSIPLPSVSSSSTTSGLASNGELADTDVPPSAQEAQLVSFSVFETKNPFKPQVTDEDVTVGTPSTPSTPTTTTPSTTMTISTPTTTPTPTAPPVTGSAVPPASSPPTPPTTTQPVTPTIAIKVNGAVSRVGSQGTFPARSPVFRVVSWTKDSAQVGIVGGSYATGDATLTLRVGKEVTLQNTTNGKTYRLELISTP